MAFIDRLKEARLKNGLTQEKLAKEIGVAKSTYTGYEKGNSEPNMLVLSKIMDVLGVDANYLYQDEVRMRYENRATPEEMEKLVKKYRLIDPEWQEAVDGVLEIGYRQYEAKKQARDAAVFMKNREKTEPAEESRPSLSLHRPYSAVAAAEGSGAFLLDDGYDEITVELNRYTQQADVILKVVGRSMEPAISNGDCVLVRRQPSVNIGEIGVFIIDGQGYLKESAPDKLLSLNPEVNDVTFGDQQIVECYGKFISVLDPDWIIEC